MPTPVSLGGGEERVCEQAQEQEQAREQVQDEAQEQVQEQVQERAQQKAQRTQSSLTQADYVLHQTITHREALLKAVSTRKIVQARTTQSQYRRYQEHWMVSQCFLVILVRVSVTLQTHGITNSPSRRGVTARSTATEIE